MVFFSWCKFEILQINFKQIVFLFVQSFLAKFQLVFYELLDLLISSIGCHSYNISMHMNIVVEPLAVGGFEKFGDQPLRLRFQCELACTYFCIVGLDGNDFLQYHILHEALPPNIIL